MKSASGLSNRSHFYRSLVSFGLFAYLVSENTNKSIFVNTHIIKLIKPWATTSGVFYMQLNYPDLFSTSQIYGLKRQCRKEVSTADTDSAQLLVTLFVISTHTILFSY